MVWLELVAVVSACGAAVCAWLYLALHRRSASPIASSTPPFRAARDGGPRTDPLLILRQSVEAARPWALAVGVTLLAPEPAGGFAISARPDALARIFGALLDNAIRHNRPDGVVLVELRQTADGIALLVHDTGQGLDPEDLSRLFQIESDTSSSTLFTARRLARAMGGRLTASSTPGQGSTFTLWLPGAAPDDRRASVLPSRDPALASAVVLYIEPDPAFVALIRQVLTALGAALHVCTSGEEGLTLARDLRPDLILVEPHLPGMDGMSLKSGLDADRLTRGVPVVALAADPEPALARRGRQVGFAGWLTKPLDIGLFTLTLRRVLAEQSSARSHRSRERA